MRLEAIEKRYSGFFDPQPFWEQALYEGCISRGMRKVNTSMAGPK